MADGTLAPVAGKHSTRIAHVMPAERARYLAEFGKDVDEAQQHLDALAGAGAP